MNDLAHHRPDGADTRFTDPAADAAKLAGPPVAPAGGVDGDAFGALVEILRRLPARPIPERPTTTGLAYDAAAAGAVALRARGCEPEAMLVQLKHALAVGLLPLSVTECADELGEQLVRHAITAYYRER